MEYEKRKNMVKNITYLIIPWVNRPTLAFCFLRKFLLR
jgi:hypothetical protein